MPPRRPVTGAEVETAEAGGARIVGAKGSSPRARIVDGPPDPAPSLSGEVLEPAGAFEGAVEFGMDGVPVWPVTIEIPLDWPRWVTAKWACLLRRPAGGLAA